MKNRIKHKSNGDFELETRNCIMCNRDVDEPVSLGVDYKQDYAEGEPQLCRKCASGLWENEFKEV